MVERVAVTDERLVAALNTYLATLKPGDTLLRRSAQGFRHCVMQCRDALGLETGVMPYSLRRGGATADFRHHGLFDKTIGRGRWGNAKTARIYINTAMADQTQATVSAAVTKRLRSAAGALQHL